MASAQHLVHPEAKVLHGRFPLRPGWKVRPPRDRGVRTPLDLPAHNRGDLPRLLAQGLNFESHPPHVVQAALHPVQIVGPDFLGQIGQDAGDLLDVGT